MGQSAGALLGRHWLASSLTLVTAAVVLLVRTLPALPGDQWLILTVQGWRTPALDTAALAITLVGWWPVSGALVALLAGRLFLGGRRRDALMAGFIPVAVAAGYALKLVVHRPRPEYLIIGPAHSGLSFPSLHALFATLLGGVVVILAQELLPQRWLRRTVQGLAVLMAVGVGASRVYLGAHWPSDVLGGSLLGVLAVLGLKWLRGRLHRGNKHGGGLETDSVT
ncbi:MAG: phosphatase PAP2 family protein [Dehalococcoidia bacterium]|nr:phosphatase PAP2 family protein [Dehalococcoidia bacterium]MSQ17150.1 phosphatase PAP2 family protein [Dehalococcoidia bacterium]